MASQQSELDIVVRARDETTASLKQIQSSVIRFVGAVSSLLSVFGAVVFPVKAAADFQKELLNVQKTTDFTQTQIRQLSRALQEMSTQIDVSATDLAKIAAAAGQLGLGSSGVAGITQFTETTARMASVLDISVEDAGTSLAKLTNIFKVPVGEVERLSSLINELSNNSTASGEEIIDITQRIGTAGGTLSAQQSASLAALGRDLGLTVETVGTSFQKIFLDLQTKAPEVAKLAGKSMEEFVTILNTDGVAGLRVYLEALTKLPAQIRAATAEQITGGGRVFGLVQNLVNDAANDFQLLNSRLEHGADGWNSGTSAIKEQQRVMQGFLKQLKLLGNSLLTIAITVGSKALPFLTDLANELQALVQDDRFVEKIKEVAEVIGSVAVAIVDAIRYIASFSDYFGILLRVAQVMIGLKLVSFFGGIASSILKSAQAAKVATQNFIALATGQKALVAAQQGPGGQGRRQQAGGALSAGTAGLAAAIGRPALQNRQNQQRALEAQNALIVEQSRLRASQAAATRLLANQQFILAQQLTAEAGLQRQIAAVRAGTAQGNLRSLNAQLAAIQLNIQAERQNLAVIQQRVATRIAERQQIVATAAAAAGAAAAQAAGGLPRIIGTSLGRAVGAMRSTFLAIGARIVSLIFPVALWVTTIVSLLGIVGELFGFDDIFDFLARLVGFSGTARRRAEIDARVRADAARKEADEIRALSDEYRRAKGVIEGFRPEQAEQALEQGTGPEFLRQSLGHLRLIQARIKQNTTDLKENQAAQAAINEELKNGEPSYERQAQLHTALNGLKGEEIKLQRETVRLQTQQEQRAAALTKFYDLDAKLLVTQLENIRRTREELTQMEQEKQKQLVRTEKVDPVLDQQIKTAEAALRQLERQFKEARDSASAVGRTFIDSIDPKATADQLRAMMNELSRLGGGVNNAATRATEQVAGRALVSEITGKAQQLVQLRELEKQQKANAEAARRQADDYKAAWERAANDAQAAVRKFTESVAKAQEAIKNRAANLLLANFDAAEQRARRIADIVNTQQAKTFEKNLRNQGLTEEEIEVAMARFKEFQEAQEEVRQQQSQINKLQLEYNTTLERAKNTETELAKEQSLQASLTKQIEEARARGDTGAVQRLTDQLAASQARGQQLIETLTAMQQKLAELRDTTVQGGVFTNAVQPIDAQKANAEIEKINAAARDATIKAAETARVLSDTTAKTAQTLEGALKTTTDQIKEIETRFKGLAEALDLSVSDFTVIGETIKNSANDAERFKQAIIDALNQDFSNSNLGRSLFDVFKNLPSRVSGATPGFASGGYISGPGTATSDSILARVSSGEYVSDAKTVSTFGPSFFSALKSISRRGSSAVAAFMASFAHGMPLPAFAGGGLVGSIGGGARNTGPGSMDVVRVQLDVGGRSVEMVGEREQARQLVKAFRNIGRTV